MFRQILLAATIALGLSAPTLADELQDARTIACDRIKACAMEKTGLNDMEPGMKMLVEAMMTGTCTAVINRYVPKKDDQASYDNAVACMLSMEKLSCEEIDNPEGEPTPECARYTNPQPAPAPDAPDAPDTPEGDGSAVEDWNNPDDNNGSE